MSQTLRDFINAREGEVKAQIKALNDELRELRAAKSAIDGSSAPAAERSPSNRVTHRDMIVAVLDEHPEGGTSDKVIDWVNEKFDVVISQASMSSQLSRAKSDGVVNLDMSTKTWRYTKHDIKENEPPKGGSESEEVGAPSKMPEQKGYEDLLGN
jgi:methionine synthase II (cobalamin-independent)